MTSFIKATTLAYSFAALGTSAWAEITITDLRDRTITLDAPAERVMLGFYYEDYLAVAGEGAVDKLVGLSRMPWESWRPKQWQAYTQAFPQLDGLHDVGDTESSTFSGVVTLTEGLAGKAVDDGFRRCWLLLSTCGVLPSGGSEWSGRRIGELERRNNCGRLNG